MMRDQPLRLSDAQLDVVMRAAAPLAPKDRVAFLDMIAAGGTPLVEIVEEFADSAQVHLSQLGYANVGIRIGDGSRGWPEHAPYDKIMVAAAAEEVPAALLEQLKPTGRLVMPLGPAGAQQLATIDKGPGGIRRRYVIPVRFTRLETVM